MLNRLEVVVIILPKQQGVSTGNLYRKSNMLQKYVKAPHFQTLQWPVKLSASTETIGSLRKHEGDAEGNVD